MVPSFDDVIAELALASGSGPVDAQDGHARWALYRQAMEAGQRPDLLLQAVRAEPDHAIALSLVLAALERRPSGERISWISGLSINKDREYAERRASELTILAAALTGTLTADALESLPEGGSDWLQLRLAQQCSDKDVLQRLRDRGHTKRIRNCARERMAALKAE